LNIQLRQDGRGDCFFDFDRDGDRDFSVIDDGLLILYENKNNYFFRNDDDFKKIKRVETIGVGDLNRDGYLDLYIGTRAKNSESDNISFGPLGEDKKLHFNVKNRSHNNEPDKRDRVDFKSKSSEIHLNFIMASGLSENDPSDIFIGRNSLNPSSRVAKTDADMAKGEPAFSTPGTYLWNNEFGQWSIVWLYGESLKEERGAITASSLYDVEPKMLETFPKEETSDRIFINQKGLGFKELKTINLNHPSMTRAVVIEDFNNDGWPDIIGIRGNEPGTYNGEPFIICNQGRLILQHQRIISLENKDDDFAQADQMVVGFANQDGLLDIFITNGYGLTPGNVGPYKLFINNTSTVNNYVILELEGRQSNRDALGARVSIYTKERKLIGYRELGAGYNRMQSTHKLHFGLGSYQGIIKAHILWPSGIEQVVEIEPNRINHIIED